MSRLLTTLVFVLTILLAACGGPALTPDQAATATMVSAQATFAARPAAEQQATMTAVMATIESGLQP